MIPKTSFFPSSAMICEHHSLLFPNLLGLLRSDGVREAERQYIFDKLSEQTAVTSTMLENLLLWSLSQQRGISTDFTKVELPALVVQVVEVFKAIAKGTKITINPAYDEQAVAFSD